MIKLIAIKYLNMPVSYVSNVSYYLKMCYFELHLDCVEPKYTLKLPGFGQVYCTLYFAKFRIIYVNLRGGQIIMVIIYRGKQMVR